MELGARYAGRMELLDPRETLPRWHAHDRAQAAAVFTAIRTCPPTPLSAAVDDPALAKAYAWHEKTCAAGQPLDAAVEDGIDRPPFMHPSGKSYAALAVARGGVSAAFVARHAQSFHVIELAALDTAALDVMSRALARLLPWEWTEVARGDRIVLSPSGLLIVDRDSLGVAQLRVYDRREWEEAGRSASVALVPRAGSLACSLPASSNLCWQSLSMAERHREPLIAATATSALLVVGAAAMLAFAYGRERRRAHADRIHVLRTLTHELRTPAMSLGIDIEHLRGAYDELPAAYQEPLLRVSDGVARLHRVLHRSARYMALFETDGVRESGGLVTRREVSSVAEMMAELEEEWPEGAVVRAESDDGPATTDPEWLGVAVRNLVENAFRHGEPPVTVTWKLMEGRLVLRVTDAGASAGLSLARAVAPYHRDPKSAGLGLGLAIVARVARLLEGTLEHEPSPTAFELAIPVRPRKERQS